MSTGKRRSSRLRKRLEQAETEKQPPKSSSRRRKTPAEGIDEDVVVFLGVKKPAYEEYERVFKGVDPMPYDPRVVDEVRPNKTSSSVAESAMTLRHKNGPLPEKEDQRCAEQAGKVPTLEELKSRRRQEEDHIRADLRIRPSRKPVVTDGDKITMPRRPKRSTTYDPRPPTEKPSMEDEPKALGDYSDSEESDHEPGASGDGHLANLSRKGLVAECKRLQKHLNSLQQQLDMWHQQPNRFKDAAANGQDQPDVTTAPAGDDNAFLRSYLYPVNKPLVEGKEWPDSTNVHCWWDCHPFHGAPIGLPVGPPGSHNKGNKWPVLGVFCSFECALAFYLQDRRCAKFDVSWLYALYQECATTAAWKLEPAPPRQALQIFGGRMTIEQFRKRDSGIRYALVTQPMMPLLQYIVLEGNIPRELDNVSGNNPGASTQPKRPKLARKTKRKGHRNTLEACLQSFRSGGSEQRS